MFNILSDTYIQYQNTLDWGQQHSTPDTISSFKNRKQEHITGLSKHVWDLKRENKPFEKKLSVASSTRIQQISDLLNSKKPYHSCRKKFIIKQKTLNYVKMSTKKRCFWLMWCDKVCFFYLMFTVVYI